MTKDEYMREIRVIEDEREKKRQKLMIEYAEKRPDSF